MNTTFISTVNSTVNILTKYQIGKTYNIQYNSNFQALIYKTLLKEITPNGTNIYDRIIVISKIEKEKIIYNNDYDQSQCENFINNLTHEDQINIENSVEIFKSFCIEKFKQFQYYFEKINQYFSTAGFSNSNFEQSNLDPETIKIDNYALKIIIVQWIAILKKRKDSISQIFVKSNYILNTKITNQEQKNILNKEYLSKKDSQIQQIYYNQNNSNQYSPIQY